ncbi:unnamed protein product [Staurois parvus]|uniref:Uncharacterized protein n=1 Tax=Staurois parvus TaxID=386267 RepID=A0ABN9DMY1_9NEOB|nr:unnamed protein product [Staurois parvus]
MQGPGRPDIVNAGSGETGNSEFRVPGRPDIVNAGFSNTLNHFHTGVFFFFLCLAVIWQQLIT